MMGTQRRLGQERTQWGQAGRSGVACNASSLRHLSRSGHPHLLALMIYTLLSILVTWPVAINFTRGIVGRVEGVDAYQNAWNLWWVSYALTHGLSPFTTPLLYYPNGVSLFWQTLGFSQGILALPVTLIIGPLAAFNFIVLTSFILAGYVTFVLVRHLTASTPAALVAGTVFAFSPFHLEKVLDGNLEVAAIQWVPWFVFALYRLLERQTWIWALLSGVGLLWVSLGSWYYGLFCVIYTGCAIMTWLLFRPVAQGVRCMFWGSIPLALWALVLTPQIMLLVHSGDTMLSDMRGIQVERSADLMDFFLPNPAHPWWGHSIATMRASIYPHAVLWNVALGSVGIVLAVVGSVTTWQHSWRWMVLLLATLLLALGPTLRIAGHDTGIPLPFTLLKDLPGIRAGQRPNHMALLSSLMVAILAGYGTVWISERLVRNTERIRRDRSRWCLGLTLIAAIVAIDGNAGLLAVVERPVHPFYTTLPEPDGAVLPLPLYYNINRSENLTPQMVHAWPILGGYVARPPAYPFITYTPGIRELESGYAEADDILSPGWPESGQRALAAYAIRYITLDRTSDKDSYFALVRARLQELGVVTPLVADATLEVYAVPRSWAVQPVGFLGPGWQALEREGEYRWRWMGAEAEIWLMNPLADPVVTTITFVTASYQQQRALQLVLDDRPLGYFSVAADQPASQQIQLLLLPGEHRLTLYAEASPDPQRANMPISVRVFQIDTAFRTPFSTDQVLPLSPQQNVEVSGS